MTTDHQNTVRDVVDNLGTWFRDEKRLEDCRMTTRLCPYSHLFSPIQVNSVKIKNRIVMGPMGNVGLAEGRCARPDAAGFSFVTARNHSTGRCERRRRLRIGGIDTSPAVRQGKPPCHLP
jgi:hypothetical protein